MVHRVTKPILLFTGVIPIVLDLQHMLWKGRGGFPGGAVVKNPPANAGDTGSSPGRGRSHMPQSN